MTTYQGTATWSDLSGTLSPAAPARFVNGVSTTEATIGAQFHNDRLMVRSGGAQERTGPFHVFGPVASISVSLPPSSKAKGRAHVYTVGGVFTLRASALDAAGNLLVGYDGPASWSSLDGVLGPAVPNPFSHGISTTTAMIASAYREDRITVTSGGVSGRSGRFYVVGPLAKIAVRVYGPVSHGVPFKLTATALDSLGTTISTLKDTPTWSCLSGGLTPTTPASFVKGVSTTMATVAAAYPNDRMTDQAGGITGHSGYFNVR